MGQKDKIRVRLTIFNNNMIELQGGGNKLEVPSFQLGMGRWGKKGNGWCRLGRVETAEKEGTLSIDDP